MHLEGLLVIMVLIGLPLFLEFFPRRPKCSYEREKLRTDAKIEYIIPYAEGPSKQRRIRTVVRFDDGFEYSACKDFRSGLFTISSTKEQQLEVAEQAIRKHTKILLKELSNNQ